ncbi:hypothetical protein HC761_01420 [bacterium]|nr:hypothetical protein [bacterium]
MAATRGAYAGLMAILLLLLSACTSTQTKRSDNLKADAGIGAGKTVVILKADIELYELLASGVTEPARSGPKLQRHT